MVYCDGKLIENVKLFYNGNRPHYLWVYRCDNPLSAEILTNPNSPFVRKQTISACMHLIKNHKSSEPLVQAANNFKFRITSIFLGPVACPHGPVIYQTRSPNA